MRIQCNIVSDSGEQCHVQGTTMNEVVRKIIDFTSAGEVEIEYYTKKGKADYLNSGWFYKEENNGT